MFCCLFNLRFEAISASVYNLHSWFWWCYLVVYHENGFVSFLFFLFFFPFGQFNESLLTPQKNKGQREWLKLLEFDFYLWVKYYNQF